ncbi:MAG: tetratricopeptide repeat protein [Armatimonadota bacterium]|nr:tetratricopeptide repeat protein [Armatimonadota bacterium]
MSKKVKIDKEDRSSKTQVVRNDAEQRLAIRVEYVGIIAVICLIAGVLIGNTIISGSGSGASIQSQAAEFIEIGNAAYDAGAHKAAALAYEKALKIDPDNPDVLTDAGTMYLRSGQVDTAIGYFRKAIAAAPNHVNSRFNLGIALMSGKKDYIGAADAFRECLRISPNSQLAAAAKAHLEGIEKHLSTTDARR